MRILITAFFVFLSGCTVSSVFVDRTTGSEYRGKTIGGVYSSQGRLTAEIEGEVFDGSWAYMSSGGNVTLGSGTVTTSGGSSAFGTVSAFGMSTAGKGIVNMRGSKGRLIRCVYEWNEWSSSGIGECERSDGRRYDLRLKQ